MSRLFAIATVACCLAFVGCATAPTTPTERADLRSDADQTLEQMKVRDPGLQALLDRAAGYAMFPDVGKGGVLVGGAYGRGILYEQGSQVGYTELSQAELGALLGGESFAELVVFDSADALQRFKGNNFSLGAGASATAVNTGAATATQFREGVAVFVMPHGGAMLDISVSGQQLNFEPFAG